MQFNDSLFSLQNKISLYFFHEHISNYSSNPTYIIHIMCIRMHVYVYIIYMSQV